MAPKETSHPPESAPDGDNNSSDYSSQTGSVPTSGSGSGDDASTVPRTQKENNLVQRETNAVFRLRLLVFLVMMFAAAAVSVTVYLVTSRAEQDQFETQFDGAASKMLETFQNVLEQKVPAISALAAAMIAHGVDHSRTWPFVTLSSFQQRASTVRKLSDTLLLGICPLVSDQDRSEWEQLINTPDIDWM
jgi:hypothetical protein